MVVHMCGRSCEMDPILEIAGRHNLKVVEDCAHAIETTYHNVGAGLIGDAGCFSFYPTKSITTGDGGMVISRNRELIERVKLLSYNGVATSAWTRFSGDVAGYEVLAAGYKYNMTDMEAALGLPQLPLLGERWEQRERLWRAYDEKLRGLPVILPSVGDPRESTCLSFAHAAARVGEAHRRSRADCGSDGGGEHRRGDTLRAGA